MSVKKRTLLTGNADDEALARVRPVLHPLLNQPCSAAALWEAIESNDERKTRPTSTIELRIRAGRRHALGTRGWP